MEEEEEEQINYIRFIRNYFLPKEKTLSSAL